MRLGGATSRAGKKPLLVPLLLLALSSVLWCVTAAKNANRPTKADSARLVAAINDLARSLSTQLDLVGGSPKAEIFSPVSIGTMMFMLLRFANNSLRKELLQMLQLDHFREGNTTARITKNFGRLLNEFTGDIAGENILEELPAWHGKPNCYPGNADDYDDYDDDQFLPEPIEPNVVKLANGMFVQHDFLQNNESEMVLIAKNLYQAQIESVNFREQPEAARSTINRWVNESTRGRIEEILGANLPRSTQVVLASALYFKATWETFFNDPLYTRTQPFFPDGEDQPPVQVPTMFNGGCFPYYASPELDASIMAFPYRNRTTSMYIILPNASNRAKVRALRAKLGSTEIDQLIGKMKPQKAMVVFPRLHLNNRYNLRKALGQLGLQALFDPSKNNLKFGQATGKGAKKLYVDSMVHQIDLVVNEHGTEGGAVTMTAMERSLPPVNFRVRGPFLIAIRHDPTKMLLFYGAVYDPS